MPTITGSGFSPVLLLRKTPTPTAEGGQKGRLPHHKSLLCVRAMACAVVVLVAAVCTRMMIACLGLLFVSVRAIGLVNTVSTR